MDGFLVPWKGQSHTGHYQEYESPEAGAIYVLGVDPIGFGARDHGAFHVLKCFAGEWSQVAVFGGVTDPLLLAEKVAGESMQLQTFTYFSFVTMTTLGYGDITPVTDNAQMLAWLEALIGQLYLAVMVAGFVATHISESMRKNRGDPPSDDPAGRRP